MSSAIAPHSLAHLKADFPVLHTTMRKKPLVYLDNAATTQKPLAVTQRMHRFLEQEYGTVNRGVYELSQNATQACDDARRTAATFLGASSPKEIVFTKGTTEAINLVAYSFGSLLKPGDEIVISEMEHHANIVPWQELCKRQGTRLVVVPLNRYGHLDINAFDEALSEKTKLVAMCHISNSLGTINPIKTIINKAKKVGAATLIDGAQAVAHTAVDVQALGCDFYAFSGHKCYGPTGIGVLFGRYDLLAKMPPFLSGGDMIETVTFEKTTFAEPPRRFEAGTPAIAEIIGLGEALTYLMKLDMEEVAAVEHDLLVEAQEKITEAGGNIIGPTDQKAAIVSFLLDDVHAHDVGTILDMQGVAVRVGHHCTQPVMQRYGVASTIRASMSFYNTSDDIDALVAGLLKVKEYLG